MALSVDSRPRAEITIEYPERLSRLLIFVKWLFAIPHMIILWFLNIAVLIISFFVWFVILITGRYPVGSWRYVQETLEWQLRVSAYTGLLRDDYPPLYWEKTRVARADLSYPPELSRGLVIVKWILIIPHVIALVFVRLAALVVQWIAWFAILITGQYPRSLFEFSVGYLRWSYRVNAYMLFLTDDYPPFSLR